MQVQTEAAERERVARWITHERERLGLKKARLAVVELGMEHTRLIDKWEAGENMPSGRYMLALIRLFGSTPDDYMRKDERPTPQSVFRSEWLRPIGSTEARFPLLPAAAA
jgi:hypothetical protein